MTGHNLLLFGHIVLVVLIFGPLVTFGFIIPGWLSKPDMLAPLQTMEKALDHIAKATGLVFLFGLFLVWNDKGIDIGDKWVGPSMGLFILGMAIGMGVIGPTTKKAVKLLESGQSAAALQSRLRIANLSTFVIVMAITWLMVAKPGA